jgi:hypothetical protein
MKLLIINNILYINHQIYPMHDRPTRAFNTLNSKIRSALTPILFRRFVGSFRLSFAVGNSHEVTNLA